MFGSARSRRATRGRSALTETIILAKVGASAPSSSRGSWYWSKPNGSPRAWNGRPPTSYAPLAVVYPLPRDAGPRPLEDAASDELLKAPGSGNLHNSSDPTGPLTYRS
jgi:hypothetical protein